MITPKIKKIFKPIYIFLLSIGIDVRPIYSLQYYKVYIKQKKQFQNLGGVITKFYPILSDYHASAGVGSGIYFHQDLLVASYIFKNNPKRHIDIASRLDGFIAHVASFREIEVFDLRHLDSSSHKNIKFIQSDLMQSNLQANIADSISCLFAIGHFGLGRYGDTIDPKGHIVGFGNIVDMLKPAGILYISFPIGRRNEVVFNAHRIFHPKDIFNWGESLKKIQLIRFDYVDDIGELHVDEDIESANLDFAYGCGIYTFKKLP